jgi:hypothetical protein
MNLVGLACLEKAGARSVKRTLSMVQINQLDGILNCDLLLELPLLVTPFDRFELSGVHWWLQLGYVSEGYYLTFGLIDAVISSQINSHPFQSRPHRPVPSSYPETPSDLQLESRELPTLQSGLPSPYPSPGPRFQWPGSRSWGS